MLNEPDNGTALSRGLTVLALILNDRGATPVSTLVAPLGMPRSTLHRVLAELADQGLVMRIARGRYDAGLVVASAATGLTLNGQLAQATRAGLRQLAAETGLTAHLGVLENEMVTYLVKAVAPSGAAAVFTQEGGQLEAYCSGIGKILLAALPSEDRDRYLDGGPFVPLTTRTITSAGELRDQLAIVRTRDFAIDDGEVSEGLRCLAVPVRDRSGAVRAAVSVSGYDPDLGATGGGLLARLRACSAQIGRQLHTGPR